MRQSLLAVLLALGFSLGEGISQDKPDPSKSDPKKNVFVTAEEGGRDYTLQGEYAGSIGGEKWGAQVVAKGDGKFEVYFLNGGLPGDGWDVKTRIKADAKTADEKTTFTAMGWSGSIEKGKLTGKKDDRDFGLISVSRTSPTIGAKPPEGAVVLFDGTSADNWDKGRVVEEKLLFCGTNLKKKLLIGKLHLEFRTPFQPKAGGQGRGNSGVYLNGDEIQILDSFGLTGANNECGGFYSKQKPAVNMCYPPLVWQTYDVEFKSEGDTTLATVRHNGVPIHENYKVGTKATDPLGINLQNHGNPVMFRNIWVVERK